MKLLMIDDEELTRTGIVNSLDFAALGVDTVLQADDGVHGLEMAYLHRPEIILCDVRMPRMDGITMLSRLEEFLPDSVVIFMSGYSDKAYLKAAIRYKAVRYIEKPFLPSEMEEAIREAVRLIRERLRLLRGDALISLEASSRLAYCLTEPFGTHREEILRLGEELALPVGEATCFRVILVQVEQAVDLTSVGMEQIYRGLQAFLAGFQLRCIYVVRRQRYVVYVVMGRGAVQRHLLDAAVSYLCSQFAPYGRFYLTVGDEGRGMQRAYDSFASAVVLMQSSFFFDAGTVLTAEGVAAERGGSSVRGSVGAERGGGSVRGSVGAEREDALPGAVGTSFEELLQGALDSGDAAQCDEVLASLFRRFERSVADLPDLVKELYFKLLLLVEKAGARLFPAAEPSAESTVSALERCFTYRELHGLLRDKVTAFLAALGDRSREDATIVMIKSYIAGHYQEPGLSVRDIGAHVYLSTSYVCTFFKNGTGQTLNQYITEFRMEKAKELLLDPRCRITDISSRVGYSDGNYFGKSFKKHTGLSPSEFREKMMR